LKSGLRLANGHRKLSHWIRFALLFSIRYCWLVYT